jgi:hypothetical protein
MGSDGALIGVPIVNREPPRFADLKQCRGQIDRALFCLCFAGRASRPYWRRRDNHRVLYWTYDDRAAWYPAAFA